MILIRVNKNYFIKDFIKEKIINLLKNLLYCKALKNKNSNLNQYLKENYNISLEDIIRLYIKNIFFIETKNEYLLNLNDFKIQNTYLINFINFVDYGNLNVKGLNLFNSSLKELKDKLLTYQNMFLLTQDLGEIWQ